MVWMILLLDQVLGIGLLDTIFGLLSGLFAGVGA